MSQHKATKASTKLLLILTGALLLALGLTIGLFIGDITIDKIEVREKIINQSSIEDCYSCLEIVRATEEFQKELWRN